MTDDLVTRIRTVFEDTPEVLSMLDVKTYAGAEAHTHMLGLWETMKDAADRIKELEGALCRIWVLNQRRGKFKDEIDMVVSAAMEGETDD